MASLFPISGTLTVISFIFLFHLCSTGPIFSYCDQTCYYVQTLCPGIPCIVNGLPGIGTYLRKCTSVYNDFRNGYRSCVCGYYFSEPIVCCPLSLPPITTVRATTIITTTTLTEPPTTTPTEPPSTTTTTEPPSTTTTTEPPSTTTTTEPPSTTTTTEPPSTTTTESLSTTTTTEPPSTTTTESLCTTITTESPSTTDSKKIVEQKCAEYKTALDQIWLKSDDKISNGQIVPARTFRHMAAIGNGSEPVRWICGGTLISERYVVTAAHCTVFINSKTSFVRVGDLNLNRTDDDALPQQIRIIDIKNHACYRGNLSYHDIALLKLEENVNLSLWVIPACLPYTFLDTSKYNKFNVTGWGSNEAYGEMSDDLRGTIVPFVPQPICNATFLNNSKEDTFPDGVLDKWQICAGGEDMNDTCKGDSGGPLSIWNEAYEMHTLIGVVSRGKPCGMFFIPAIYTNVSSYVEWITGIVWPEEKSEYQITGV